MIFKLRGKMNPILVEVIGIVSTLFIVLSMLFKTTTQEGAIAMRFLNLLGSAIFVVYGCLLPAISTAILNGVLVIVNFYHLVMLVKNAKKSNKKDQ